jgi:hypothetical protein
VSDTGTYADKDVAHRTAATSAEQYRPSDFQKSFARLFIRVIARPRP